jgi:GNAT superfamily N-acetyltransferase
MNDLLKRFRTGLSEAVLDAIWAAWAQVGVMGQSQPSTPRIVDPEPLLLLTLECARQDPRVSDEVLDWLVRNGRWVNVVRLSTLLPRDQICPPSLAGAVAAFMMQHDKSPKWRNLAERRRSEPGVALTALFQRQGKPLMPIDDEQDVWAITCFFVHRDARASGVATALLDAAVAFAGHKGARIVEAYPVATTEQRPDAELWRGTEEMFAAAGFEAVVRRKPRRPIMRRVPV